MESLAVRAGDRLPARSSRRSVTRNKNRSPVMSRLRLGMLVPSGEVQLEAADVLDGGGIR